MTQKKESVSEARLREECERYGLPVGLNGLLRHIYNNHAATLGAKDFSIRILEERAITAEAERDRLAAALRNEMRLRQGYPLDEGEVRKATYKALSETPADPHRERLERAARDLAEAVAVGCGSRLSDRDVVLSDKAQAVFAALDPKAEEEYRDDD